jgi:hypothetical protein
MLLFVARSTLGRMLQGSVLSLPTQIGSMKLDAIKRAKLRNLQPHAIIEH